VSVAVLEPFGPCGICAPTIQMLGGFLVFQNVEMMDFADGFIVFNFSEKNLCFEEM